MELRQLFHGGDPGLRDSLYRMQADNSERLQQQYCGPSSEMIDYIRRANAVSFTLAGPRRCLRIFCLYRAGQRLVGPQFV